MMAPTGLFGLGSGGWREGSLPAALPTHTSGLVLIIVRGSDANNSFRAILLVEV